MTDALVREGWAREVVRHIQTARKDSGFAVTDRIRVCYAATPALAAAIATHRKHIAAETLALALEAVPDPSPSPFDATVGGHELRFALTVAEPPGG